MTVLMVIFSMSITVNSVANLYMQEFGSAKKCDEAKAFIESSVGNKVSVYAKCQSKDDIAQAPALEHPTIDLSEIHTNLNLTSSTPSAALTGSGWGEYAYAYINLADSGATDKGFYNGLLVIQNITGPSARGGRQTIQGVVVQSEPTSAESNNRNYVGVVGMAGTSSGDGGTGKNDLRGGYFGMNPVAIASGGEWIMNLSGLEVNTQMYGTSGHSVWYMSGAQLTSPIHKERAWGVDAALAVSQGGEAGWGYGLVFGGMNGGPAFTDTSTVLGAWSPEKVDYVFDLRNFNAKTALLKGNNITITDGSITVPTVNAALNGNAASASSAVHLVSRAGDKGADEGHKMYMRWGVGNQLEFWVDSTCIAKVTFGGVMSACTN